MPSLTKAEIDQLREKHPATIRPLAEEGKLLKAGPFEELIRTQRPWDARRGPTDPLVKIGRLVPQFLKWHMEKGSLK
jgi:uncharacterized protein YciI